MDMVVKEGIVVLSSSSSSSRMRFLISRTKTLFCYQPQHSSSNSRFLRNLLHSFHFHSTNSSGRSSSIDPNSYNYNTLDDNRVPATVITGFLGSGKTTLLNHILSSQHGKRIAVIENEFGEVDIDGSLVASHSSVSEDIIMVNNGCLCCTVRGDLVKMLLKLVKEKRDKFDHIVIETTDGVVTLVDSKHAMQHLNEVKPRFVVNEAVEQVAYADRIIFNKIDLVSEAELEVLTKKIKHINGLAQIKLAKFGSVDMDFVLGVGGYDLERFDSEAHLDSSCSVTHQHEAGHGHHTGHHHDHAHDSAVSSVSIVSEGTLDLDE
ncbi:hypothetical protein RGQ29_032645, partial [Quercus rubra]